MLASHDLLLWPHLVAPEKQGEQGKNTTLSPIPISSPDSTLKLPGPEHLGNLILQFRLCSSTLPSPKCTVGVVGARDGGVLAQAVPQQGARKVWAVLGDTKSPPRP